MASEEILLNSAELIWAASLIGVDRADYAYQRRWTGHYSNRPWTHLVGALGEVGVEKWANDQRILIDSPFREPTRYRECDVILKARSPRVRVEVKTWREDTWPAWGRCVQVDQMKDVIARADAIVWATVERRGGVPVVVHIMGWSFPKAVAERPAVMTGPPEHEVENHQVDTADLLPLRDLLRL